MGVVYEGEDPRLRRHVAIKLLPEQLARDDSLRGRFEREAQLLAALNHPNISTIHSLEADGEAHFLTMEFVEGDTLAERIDGRPLPIDEVLRVGRQIANALEAAHRKGIVHRDLKPLNVKITPEDRVKVLDFGLAKALQGDRPRRPRGGADPGGEAPEDPDATIRPGAPPDPDATIRPGTEPDPDATLPPGAEPDPDATIRPGAADSGATRPLGSSAPLARTLAGDVLGTPGYMSPEQLNGLAVDARADVFAFGCVLWECLTGTMLFGGDTLRERMTATLTQRFDPSPLPADTPDRLRALLERCLARNPDDRLPAITEARRELEEEIAQRALPAPAAAPRERTGPNNLPAQLTSFVGREDALGEVRRLLGANRLVTLTGAGGSGKTRLAVEAGWSLVGELPHGVWRAELAALADAGPLAATVATALGLREEPGRSVEEQLVDHLRERELVLVLDNCEHLLADCARLAQTLLASCPGLRVLATSVEILGVPGETVYHVPLLSLPAEGATPDEVRASEAGRLFAERAAEARPDFEIDAANADAVARICRRLDGIPLALELAAARVKVLSPEDIAERLRDRFRLLTSRSRTALPRHQTLRALIDWSYQHLDDAERALLRRLSVFAGGFTLDAAETVGAGDDVEEWEILDLVSNLVDKSLLSADTDRSVGTDRARYRMLETVRAYAREKLEEADEAAEAAARHRAFFVALAEEAEPRLTGPEQAGWLLRLDADHDNFRAALAGPDPAAGEDDVLALRLRLAGALGRFWNVRGYWSEGRDLTAELLEEAEGREPDAAHAKVLHWAGNLAYRQGDYGPARDLHVHGLAIRRRISDRPGIASSLDSLGAIADANGDLSQALVHLEESLAIRRELGDRWAVAISLNNVGVARENTGDLERARELHEEALAIRRGLGEPAGIAGSLSNLGTTLESLRDLDAARACHAEALELRRGLGDRWGIGLSLKNLGRVLLQQGHLEEAEPLLGESIDVFRRIGERHELSQSLGGLGEVARRRGDPERAAGLFREALAIRRELGEPRGIAASVEALAAVAADRGEAGVAARLLGAAEAMRDAIGVPRWSLGEQRVQDIARLATEALGEEGFARERDAGRRLSADEAVAAAAGVTTGA
jgi:non-specific serine/threonine protein kinase